MTKLARSAEELGRMVLAEAANQPVCPRDLAIAVRSDVNYGWKADVISPQHVGSADCVRMIAAIAERLRREYRLTE